MIKTDFLILGGGPAGLTLANSLVQKKASSVLVLEKENEAGGLCRSKDVDGWALDIGGGHFLDVRRPKVNEFLFRFMGQDEWDIFERDSRIVLDGDTVSHPLEANIWQLEPERRKEYLESIKNAGCNKGLPMPEKFVDWITWKLGERIAQDYMLPYNKKMFADELDELGTYWLDKLPNVSYEETLRSCDEHRAFGKQPGHARFYYPKRTGYGELWNRMADELGGRIRYNEAVVGLDAADRTVITESGTEIRANVIVTTVPWRSITKLDNVPDDIKDGIKNLKHSSIEVRYFDQRLDTDAQWLYCPSPSLAYHRILVRHNFCSGNGYWTETRKERTALFTTENEGGYRYMNEYAYPLNTIEKPGIVEALLGFMSKHGIYGLGRWGEHSHYNSDVVVDKAMDMAEKLV